MSDSKTIPLCPVFGECGGCFYQDVPYEEELSIKQDQLKELLQDVVDDSLIAPAIASPHEYHYRHRLDLKLKRIKSGEVFVGFTPNTRRGVIEVQSCPIAMKVVSDFIPQLKSEAIEKLTPKYREASLVVRTGDDGRVLWGGIGRRSCQLPQEDYLWTTVCGRKIFYSLDTFFQANLSILPKLFEVIHSFSIWNEESVFFDLYGGVGLFGMGVVDKVKKVFLIEDSPASIKLAQYNIEHHHFKNFELISGRVEDHLSSLLESVPGSKVAMIDPPRAGLSDEARAFMVEAKQVEHLMYLSCHPESLARDLKAFKENGWGIETVTPFDFFPKTKHLETLVLLKPQA